MKEVFDGKTYYDILELSSDCGANEILTAYEKIKAAYSPSSPALYTIFTSEEAQQLNGLIDTAFSVLSNPIRRTEYDKSLKSVSSKSSNIEKVVNEKPVDKKSNKNEVSQNVGRTSFGNYTLDLSFEDSIKNTDVFDGAFIQKIRHYKNINLEQLSDRSKISKTYLLAIESHDFESLPAKVFVRGFIVQISKLLILDTDKVTNSFMKIFDKAQK